MDTIVVKNKQTSLEERITRAKKTLGKMHIPQVLFLSVKSFILTTKTIVQGKIEDKHIKMQGLHQATHKRT